MKARSAALIAYHGEAVTTPAWCWKVTRTDAAVYGFTSVDVDLVVGGITYAAATGFTPSSIDGRADMSVPNLEVSGMLDSAALTEADLQAGKWDGAAVEVFEVNYKDLTMGSMALTSGTIGNVSAGRAAFTAELRSLLQKLQQPFGRVFSQGCQAVLGDTQCKVVLASYTVSGSVTTATSNRAFADSTRAEAADYFGAGLVIWLTGANAGLRMEVLDFSATAFVLALPMPYTVAVGDTYQAIAGCRHRHQRNTANPSGVSDCKDKFNNIVNFRGHPFVPGNDKVLGNAALASA